MEIIKLPTYNIYIGHILQAVRHFVKEGHYSGHCVIVDENTQIHCLPVLQSYLPDTVLKVITIPAGEIHKNIRTCERIWEEMMQHKLDRNALVINLGGGVVGDMGGFCASTFKRGIDFVQVPTTLLSQVDASVGGKLGIDFADVKNSIGLFKDPGAVFIDPAFLHTLSEREIRSGFAEIVKHCLIADRGMWEKIRHIKSLDTVDWLPLISHSVMIKKRIVESDPHEKGLRKALNFGHTIGHAIESFFLETTAPLLHGEAIAIGMICEGLLSQSNLGLPQEQLKEVLEFLTGIYPSPTIPDGAFDQLLSLMLNDKKNIAGRINFSLINPIGEVHVNREAQTEDIRDALTSYGNLAGNS